MTDAIEFVCAYVLQFRDGTSEGVVVGTGTKAECDGVARLLGAIAYSGDKPIDSARMFVMPVAEWLAIKAEAEA